MPKLSCCYRLLWSREASAAVNGHLWALFLPGPLHACSYADCTIQTSGSRRMQLGPCAECGDTCCSRCGDSSHHLTVNLDYILLDRNLLSLFRCKFCVYALFSFFPKVYTISHRMFRYMYEVLNID
jgi:hypothetical protein